MLFTNGPVVDPTIPTELASVYRTSFSPGAYRLKVVGSTENATGRIYIHINGFGTDIVTQWVHLIGATGPFVMDFGKVDFTGGSGLACQVSVDTSVAATVGTFQATLVLESTGYTIGALP